MRKIFFAVLGLALFALLGLRLYQEFSATSEAGSNPAGGPGAGRATMLVDTALVESRPFETSLDIVGELKAAASVEVMSRISGRLSAVNVYRGDTVRRGQELAVLEDDDLRQQIRRSEASVLVARAAAKREEATVDNLRLQLNRLERLHDEELVSVQDLQDLQSRVRVAESQLELAQAQIQQAEAALHELTVQREQTRIYSPLDGVVGDRYLEPGSVVNPSVPIVSVISLDRVKTVVPVPERTLLSLRVGLPSSIGVDAVPGRSYRGSITRLSPFLNPQTRTADVEIEIPNPEQTLKPGMFARVHIDVNTSQESLSVPRSALLTRGDQKGVYLLTPDLRTVFQPVAAGRVQGNFVEILEGLAVGTRVVTTGAQSLNEGDTVKIPQETSAAGELAPSA